MHLFLDPIVCFPRTPAGTSAHLKLEQRALCTSYSPCFLLQWDPEGSRLSSDLNTQVQLMHEGCSMRCVLGRGASLAPSRAPSLPTHDLTQRTQLGS